MKLTLIRYTRETETESQWQQEVGRFVAALDQDPELAGRIAYRSMNIRGTPDYVHMAAAMDDAAVKRLQERDYFQRFTAATRRVSGNKVTVTPVDVVAETASPA